MNKDTFEQILSGVCIFGAILISFLALLLPPQGVIHYSVLILIGEVLFFVGAVLGIKSSVLSQIAQINKKIAEIKNGEYNK